MPQLRPNSGQGTLSFQDIINQIIAGAVPPGFDPSTPESVVRTGPGIGQSLDIAQNEGRLAGIANLAKFMQLGRGTVGNPTHEIAQTLQRQFPKVYNALERRPQTFEFADLPLSEARIMRGDTKVPFKAQLSSLLKPNPSLPREGAVDISAIGTSPIKIRVAPDSIAEGTTPLHESLHALLSTNPNRQNAVFPPEHADKMLFGNLRGGVDPTKRSLGSIDRAEWDPRYFEVLLDMYKNSGGLSHLSVEGIAQAMNLKRLRQGY